MRKLILASLFCFAASIAALATGFLRIGSIWGPYMQPGTSGGSQITLNGATLQVAFPFTIGPTAKTITSVMFFCSGVTGTLTSSDIVTSIYSDASNLPSSSVASTTTVAATPTGTGVVQATGLSYAASTGTQYWVVITNADATPTTNFFKVQGGPTASIIPTMPFSTQIFGFSYNGTSYASMSSAPAVIIGFSDGSFIGSPVYGTSGTGGSSFGAFGANQSGVTFTTPANVNLITAGATMNVLKNGSPSGNLEYVLYSGTTAVATSIPLPPANAPSTPAAVSLWWAAGSYTLLASTTYHLMAVDTAADSTSAYYGVQRYTIMGNSTAAALLPYTMLQTVSTNSGTSFTTSNFFYIPWGLFLDQSGEFAPGSGGSSQVGYVH